MSFLSLFKKGKHMADVQEPVAPIEEAPAAPVVAPPVTQIPVVAVDEEEAPQVESNEVPADDEVKESSEVPSAEDAPEAPVEALAEAESPAEELSEASEEVPAEVPAAPEAESGELAAGDAVKLSAAVVASLGLGSNEAEFIEKNDVESKVKVGDKELVVGNEEIS